MWPVEQTAYPLIQIFFLGRLSPPASIFQGIPAGRIEKTPEPPASSRGWMPYTGPPHRKIVVSIRVQGDHHNNFKRRERYARVEVFCLSLYFFDDNPLFTVSLARRSRPGAMHTG